MSQALTAGQIDALLAGPAGKPPAGVTPNFNNPPSLEAWLIFAWCLWMSISTLAFAARLTTEFLIERKMHPEDYIITIAWLAQVGVLVNSIYAAKYGIGRHMWDVTLSNFIRTQYFENIISTLYVVAIGAIKLAILLQILRVFVPNGEVNRPLFVGCMACIGFVVIFYIIDFCLELAQCVPREKIWNPFVEGGSCVGTAALYESTGVFNVVTDFAILVLPLPTIYALQCGWRKKLAIGGVFAAGFIVCIISILRTYYTWRLFTATDVSYEITFLGFWTWAELCAGTLVFCLPIIPKFFHLMKDKAHTYILSRLKPSTQNSSSQSHDEAHGPEQDMVHSKPLYPHMVVSFASWEQPEPGDASRMELGNAVSVTRSVTVTDVEMGPVHQNSDAHASGTPATASERV